VKKIIVVVAAMLVFATAAFAQIGTIDKDLVFTPVTPCRIMDTRNSGTNSGLLLAGTTRTFNGISLSVNFPNQGGSSPSCGIPFINEVAALVLNFTVVTPDTGGYITAFPADATQPTAATVNFTAGSVVGNNATLKLAQNGSGQFKIYSTSNVHVVGDVVGYYAKPVATALECIDTVSLGTTALAASGTVSISSSACTTGYTMTGGSCVGGTFGANVVTSRVLGSTYFCAYQNSLASASTVEAIGRCCRIPGR
jgi:hypothetical protein